MTISNGLENNELPFLAGGGEMGNLIRAINWDETQLGKPSKWPLALKQTVSMILTTTVPMLVCWGDDYIQLYNDAFKPIGGETKHPQALGRKADLTYSESWNIIGPLFQEARRGDSISLSNFKVPINRNGFVEDAYFDFSCSPIRDENGHIGGILVICIETTQQVHNSLALLSTNEELAAANEELAAANEEQAAANEEYAAINEELAATNEELIQTQHHLERSEKLFKSIALNIPNSLILVIDKNHRFITIEGDIMEKMGYDSRDYTGKHPTEVAPPERYEASKHLYERVMAGEKFSEERQSAITGDYFMVHFVPLKNDRNEVENGLIIALEITDIKQNEERSAKLAAIIESSDDAIISKTLESVITSWNDSAMRMFGYTSDEMIGETIYKLIPEDRKEEEPQILARLKNGDRVTHFETKRRAKSGKLIDVSLTISPVKDKSGQIIGLSKIARDITFKKEEEQRKNDFVAMVSHELKTPLTTIHSYIQLLLAKAQKDGDEFHLKALTRTEVQTKRMTAMINDFLSIARLEEGEMSIHKNVFELQPLAEEIALDVQFLTAKHRIKWLGFEGVKINGDREKIGQVLNNLLTNAIKYSPEGGEVILGCENLGDSVKIYVQDQGVGIKPEDQKHLSERFYRAEDDKLKMVSGFGLGLYLVSEILRHHGSNIKVESEENVGSTFYFYLPLAP